jgi:hypothetical protein
MIVEEMNIGGNKCYFITDSEGNEYVIGASSEEDAIIKCNEIKKRRELERIPSYKELRAKEYPSTDELIVALWELVVENRPESANELQAKREAVKQKYPKG